MKSINDIYNSLHEHPSRVTSEYADKMLHRVPVSVSIDRAEYIGKQCKDRRVLNLGSASGELHSCIKLVAKSIIGIDREQPADYIIDLDASPYTLPDVDVDIVVAGEIIEHLGNPGNLLKSLRHYNCPLLITVPNAGCVAGSSHLKRGYENVNKDHVAWYSWKTLSTLLGRYGYKIDEFYWYNGKPLYAEGLIVKTC